jgi:protein TonB
MPPEARLPQPPAVSAPAEEPAPGSGGRAPIAPADEAAPGNRAAAPPQGPAEPPALREAVPEYGKNRAAEYPRRARQLGFEGVVVLEVLVNPGGGVDEVRLFSSSGHAILDESAARSVRAWTFTPARRGEQAIPMWVRVPIRFELGAP